MTLTPSSIRLDLKCGKGAISKGEKCSKGPASVVEKVAPIALGLGLAAGAIALRRRGRQKASTAERKVPSIPKDPPKPPPTTPVQRRATEERPKSIERKVEATPKTKEKVSPVTSQPTNTTISAPKGWRNTTTNEKHNYVMGKHPDLNVTLGKSTTPAGNVIDFKLGSSGEVEFRVNGDTNRRQNISREEGATILSRVERMLQASIKDLPNEEVIWTNAYSNDGLGKKRESLYKRYGFQRDPADPTSKELFTTVGELKKRSRRSDALITMRTSTSIRADLKCGKGAISEGEKCTKGPATKVAIAAGIGLTAGALALGAAALSKRGRSGSTRPSGSTSSNPVGPSPTPRLPGSSPRALLQAAPPRQSKTQRMRANTAAAVKNAEGRIAQTAREEVRRIAQIGNTMAAAGEATGMAAKTTMRELRLRTEAARRRWEPGYRRGGRLRAPAQLSPGADPAFQAPLTTPRRPAPEAVPVNPRTGQPRRRRAQGFGRRDNYIPVYASVQLQPPTRRDADDGKKYTKVVTNPETGRKNRVRYGAKGYRIAPGTDKGDNYCARSFGDMKSEGYDCSGAERNTPLCLSRAKWKCSGKTSRRGS